ncbi:MAG TPA: Arm DNA-binding domain-containing protein [Sphingobium sp.]|nr:Arm DNA-binding domain-containing protein [Sphingobium sp.]
MSRKLTLTPSAVDALVEGSINDPLTPGLSLERLPSGKKIWRCSRWVPANRTLLRRSLSAYPAHSITSARAWASELNSQIEAGMDPRDIEREEEKRSGMTVRRAHTLYMEAVEQGRSSRAKRKNKPRTISDTRANGR